jgi:hypothetical protein
LVKLSARTGDTMAPGSLLAFLIAVQAAATFFAKNALGRPTNRAWLMTPLTNAAVVIGL